MFYRASIGGFLDNFAPPPPRVLALGRTPRPTLALGRTARPFAIPVSAPSARTAMPIAAPRPLVEASRAASVAPSTLIVAARVPAPVPYATPKPAALPTLPGNQAELVEHDRSGGVANATGGGGSAALVQAAEAGEPVAAPSSEASEGVSTTTVVGIGALALLIVGGLYVATREPEPRRRRGFSVAP